MPDDLDDLIRRATEPTAPVAEADPLDDLIARASEGPVPVADVRRRIFGDVPEDMGVEGRQAVLNRVTGTDVSPGGTDLTYADKANLRYGQILRNEMAKVIPGAQSKEHAAALLRALPEKPAEPEPATFGEQATTVAKRFVKGMTTPPRFLASALLGEDDAAKLDSEHTFAPGSGAGLSPEREAAAQAALESTTAGRVALGAADLLPALPGLKVYGGALKGAGKLAGPGALAVHGGLEGGVEGFGGGAAFGLIAGGLSIPLQKWIDRLPAAVKGTVVERLANAGEGAVTFAAADAILHGPDGERALEQAILGGALGFRKALAKTNARPGEDTRVTLARGMARLEEGKAAGVAKVEAAVQPGAEPVPGEPTAVTLKRGLNRLAAQAAPEAPAAPREEVIQPAVEAKPAPRSKAVQRGAVNPEVVTEAADRAVKFGRRFLGSYVQRIRDYGGPEAARVADLAGKTADATRKNLGEVAPELNEALKVSGGFPGTEKGKAATSLSTPVEVEGKSYLKSRLADLIEGRAEPTTPAEQAIVEKGRALIDKLGRMAVARGVKQQGGIETGEWEQDYGAPGPGGTIVPRQTGTPSSPILPIPEPVGVAPLGGPPPMGSPRTRATVSGGMDPLIVPERLPGTMPGVEPTVGKMTEAGNANLPPQYGVAPFRYIPGGKVFPRIMTPEFHDVMQQGPKSPLWKKVIDAFADINGLERTVVDKDFTARWEENTGVRGPEAHQHKTQVEFRRQYRQVPTALRHEGEVVSLFESNPFNYFKRLAETRAARYGVIENFGQDLPTQKPVSGGTTGLLTAPEAPAPERDTPNMIRTKFAKETGADSDFTALMRGLHGQAIRKPIIDPGTVRARLARGTSQVLKALKTINLSASAVQNIPEPLGNVSAVAGLPAVTKRLFQMLGRTKSWKDAKVAAEIQGAVTRDVMNLSWDPAHKFNSAIRIFSEVGRKAFGHGYVNESQEAGAAVVARDMVARFKVNKGKDIDAQRMMGAGINEAVARRLASGKATEAEYDAFVRRMPGLTVGANLNSTEQSAVEASRLHRSLVAFARYSWMSARSAGNQSASYLRTMQSAIKGTGSDGAQLTGAQRWTRALSAHRALGGWVTGKVLQGSGAYLLTATVTGGKTGASIAWNELKDDPLSFATESFWYATFGGPIGAIARAASGKGKLENAIYPWFVAKEIAGLVGGVGPQYQGKNARERFSQFFTRTAPINRIAETGLVALGLGSEQGHKIDTSKRAFYRWRYDYPRKGTFIPADTDEQSIEYRANIRRAYEATVKGEPPDVVNAHVMKALGIEGKDESKIATSLKNKRLLTAKAIGIDGPAGEAKDAAVAARLAELKARIGEDAYRNLELHDTLLTRLAATVKDGEDDEEGD